jgi:UDP-N-acetylglucosamine:LPS N-acetylglucosamine transferase
VDSVGLPTAKASEGLVDVVVGTGWLVSAPVLQAAPFIKTLSLHGEPVEGEVNRIVFSTRTE